IFHQTVYDNGFAVVDGPGNSGWLLQRARDARDNVIPTYDSTDFPVSSRLMTVAHSLKHVDSGDVARLIRSFMPANSRIIPATPKQVIITDRGRNIHRTIQLIKSIDTEEVARRSQASKASQAPSSEGCAPKEQRISKLVVENLEIGEKSG